MVFWIACLYLLWQVVWLNVFFFKLAQVNDYSDLFTFMNGMGNYTNSVIVRICFSLISNSSITVSVIVKSIMNSVYLFDWICMGICILYLSTRKRSWIVGGSLILYFILLCCVLSLGLRAGALSSVISLLRGLAIFSLVYFVGFAIFILFQIVKNIFNGTF